MLNILYSFAAGAICGKVIADVIIDVFGEKITKYIREHC